MFLCSVLLSALWWRWSFFSSAVSDTGWESSHSSRSCISLKEACLWEEGVMGEGGGKLPWRHDFAETLFTEALEQCGFPLCLMFPLLFLSHLKVADMFSTFLMLAACKDIRRACSVCVLSLLCFDDYVTFKAKNVFAHKQTFRFDSAPVISIPEVTKQ